MKLKAISFCFGQNIYNGRGKQASLAITFFSYRSKLLERKNVKENKT